MSISEEAARAMQVLRKRCMDAVDEFVKASEDAAAAAETLAKRRLLQGEYEARAQMLEHVKGEKTESQREARARVALLDGHPLYGIDPESSLVCTPMGAADGEDSGMTSADDESKGWTYAEVCASVISWEAAHAVRLARAEGWMMRWRTERAMIDAATRIAAGLDS